MGVMRCDQRDADRLASRGRRHLPRETVLAAAAIYEAMHRVDEGVPATFQVTHTHQTLRTLAVQIPNPPPYCLGHPVSILFSSVALLFLFRFSFVSWRFLAETNASSLRSRCCCLVRLLRPETSSALECDADVREARAMHVLFLSVGSAPGPLDCNADVRQARCAVGDIPLGVGAARVAAEAQKARLHLACENISRLSCLVSTGLFSSVLRCFFFALVRLSRKCLASPHSGEPPHEI